jgi:hypothetical protein
MDDAGVMLHHLAAEGPHPDHAEELMLFGRLIGSWDIEITSIDPEGARRSLVAEWHFAWALEGRAVQDVLITRSLEGSVVGFGTTVRTFDPHRGQWWVVWQDPLAGEFSVLLARAEGDRIGLQGQWTIANAVRPFRWTFSDITPDSFRWECHILENEGSDPGRSIWRLAEEIRASRASGGR